MYTVNKKTHKNKNKTHTQTLTIPLNIENKLAIFQNTVHRISALQTGNAAVNPISQWRTEGRFWMNQGELLLKMSWELGFRGSGEHWGSQKPQVKAQTVLIYILDCIIMKWSKVSEKTNHSLSFQGDCSDRLCFRKPQSPAPNLHAVLQGT